MGKLSGLFTTAIFVGLVAVLVYFCCRVKRKPGTIVQRSAMEFNAQPIQPITPSGYPGGLSGYPHVIQQQSYPPTSSYGQGYPPAQSAEHQQSSNFNSYSAGYPPNPNGAAAPYPPMSNNPPYPTAGGGGIPMPMPMPMSNHSSNIQPGSAPNFPTAPRLEPADLPPPYESVVRQS